MVRRTGLLVAWKKGNNLLADTEVVVVGAGAAGLSAAKELARLGISYRLLEGSQRIGGRAFSEEIVPGEWFDWGCAWLVGGETNPFTKLARDLGFELSTETRDRFKFENLRFVRDGIVLDEEERSKCVSYYESCEAAIANAVQGGQDIALSKVIKLDNDFAQPFLTNIDASWGKEVDQVSSVDHVSCVGDLGYQVPRGYGNLVATWGAEVPVSLGTCVEKIDWSRSPMVVETNRGTITANFILMTVSTGVLASDQIAFRPQLPDWKQESILSLPMGTENKIGVSFDRDVFGNDGRAYYTTWTTTGHAAKVDAGVKGSSTAVVFVGGQQGIALERQGPQALVSFAMDRLADIFGNEIRKHVVRCIATAWESDPWTRGTWACAAPAQSHQRANLARPIDGRLFFAGEATMVGPQGTCHGAYLSGIEAAGQIAHTLRGARP